MNTKLLTPEQLADIYQISVKRIYALAKAGKLRVVRLPGSRLLRFDPQNLEADSGQLVSFPKEKKAA